MTLYDSKYVYFDWDDKLEGKKGFFADNITDLKQYVKDNRTMWYGEICHNVNTDNSFPFGFIDDSGNFHCFRFCYYDPYYEFRRAYLEGKQLQFKDGDNWIDIDGVPLFTTDEYRIKPDDIIWKVVLSDDGALSIAKTTDKHVYFKGTGEECSKWINEHSNFADIMWAWEREKKPIQFYDDYCDKWRNCKDSNDEPCEPNWKVGTEYRINPENTWHVILVAGTLVYSNAETDDKHFYFEGTKEECDEWINVHEKFELVMLAWEQGKTIQYNSGNGWEDCCDNNPSWEYNVEYRIKDECKGCMKYDYCCDSDGVRCKSYCTKAEYVPFDTVNELIKCWEKKFPGNANRPEYTMPLIWIKNKEKNRVYLISDFWFDANKDWDVGTSFENLDLEDLFEYFTFLDGSIIGKRSK